MSGTSETGVGEFTARLRLFIELASVATAASFLTSALALVAIFKIWNLDFFALASVSDVVMGGTFILAWLLLLLLIVFVVFALATLIREKDIWIIVLMALIGLVVLGHLGLAAAIASGRIDAGWLAVYQRWASMAVFLIFGGIAARILMDRPTDVYNKLKELLENWGRAVRIGIGFLLVGLFAAIATLADTGFAGLYSFPVPAQHAALGCPNHQAHVMWIGERAIIIRCGSRFRVLLEHQGLLLEKVDDRLIPPGSATYFSP